ncbi:epidermal growth factor receptor kinase substrate 8-like protein 3b [Polymixia lowei]
MYGNSAPFTYSPRAFAPEDLPQQRRTFQQEDRRSPPFQRNSTSRPSGKSIYLQRREYSETLNKQPDNFQYRVEHLFTCELDGQEVRSLNDCVAKLKRLDAKGRLWPQEMIMEVQGGYLQLNDIETKGELESLPLNCIQQTQTVLDSCVYNSLLTVTLQERNKRVPQVFMFQCEEIGAEHIKSDLDKAVQNKGGDGHQSDIRNNLENIIGQHASGGFQHYGLRAVHRDPWVSPPQDETLYNDDFNGLQNRQEVPPPLEYAEIQRNTNRQEVPPPLEYTEIQRNTNRQEVPPPLEYTEIQRNTNRQEVPPPLEYTEIQRNTEILNHVLNDIELFMGKVFVAGKAPEPKEDKKKKMFPKKSQKKNVAPAVRLPPWEEYVSCLQIIKYGFNLLGKLNGELTHPTAQDFVHILFSSLGMIVPHYPRDLPPSVLTPLLTEPALLFLSQVVSPEEDQLWRALGDSWNIPRSKWADGDMVPPYIPEFSDGWQPPAPLSVPPPYQNGPISRSNSQRFPPTHGPPPLDMMSTSSDVKAWLEYKGFSKMTVRSLGVLNGSLLLGMTRDDMRTVCPEEGGRVFFQLQSIKSAIAVTCQ